MLTTALFVILYLAIAGAAIALTYLEQRNTGNRNFLFTTLGFLACAVWPLTFLTVAIAVAIRPSAS